MIRAAGPGASAPALMTGAMLAFTLNDACMKAVGGTMPLPQALLLRGFMTIALLGAFAWRTGALRWRGSRRDVGWLAVRTAGEVGAAFFFIAAIFVMPLANATAILQALPLTVTAAAALLLGERVGARRWAAVAAGFVGVLLILRPGADGFGAPSLYALAAVACVTMRDVATRRMARAIPAGTAALWAALGVTGTAALAMPFVEPRPVTLASATLLAGSASFLVAAYLMSVAVMRAGEVSESAPFRYTGLVWALLLGLVLFGEWPDGTTLLGAAVVVGAGLFALRRERIVAGQPARGPRRNR